MTGSYTDGAKDTYGSIDGKLLRHAGDVQEVFLGSLHQAFRSLFRELVETIELSRGEHWEI